MVKNIELPDIGDFDEVEVIEILVSVGDTIAADDSIITLESDKASMEIPCPSAGVVTQININLGDKIKQGDSLISIETGAEPEKNIVDEQKPEQTSVESSTKIVPVIVPDIGDFDEVEVIEILVAVGDELAINDSMITLESDKASIEIPAPITGIVSAIKVNLGDKVSIGDLILEVQSTDVVEKSTASVVAPAPSTTAAAPAPSNTLAAPTVASNINQSTSSLPKGDSHASPSIRKLARELGVNLSKVSGTGQKGRVLGIDLKGHVKQIITSGGMGSGIPKTPVIDFSKFGEIEVLPLSRINKISGKHLTACWLNIPHVIQFDEVNIDKMQDYRQAQKAKGVGLTPLVFIMKAVVKALQNHPRLNASLDESGENLIIKKYFNLGIAMDTPNGLVVPVIRDVEKKSIIGLAEELRITSQKARDGKLKPADMQGAGFTISSLGGIGGTQFTPIVNAPEVAILGVSRSLMKPVWNGKAFEPVMSLPLALSYDHRVVDGAQGGRFMADLNKILTEVNYD